MRLRIFSIGLLAGLISAILVTMIHISYVRSERLSLIDEQLRDTAQALVKSDLGELRRGEYEEADDIISEELGPRRIGKIFVLRNAKEEILFQSQSAAALAQAIPQDPQWITHHEGDRFIRVLNLHLPTIPDRTLQVGTVLDKTLVGWYRPTWRILFYSLAVLFVISIASFALSLFVMRPFRRLHTGLELVARDLSTFREVRMLPREGFQFALRHERDEFGRTLRLLNDLIDRINVVTRFTKLWSVRLAHELKTPITVLRLEIEDGAIEGPSKNSAIEEIDRISRMVGGFLSWAEAGMDPAETEIPAVSISTVTAEIAQRLTRVAAARLLITTEADWTATALREHLDTMIGNLVENALKYSPMDSSVQITIRRGQIEIKDYGPGLPPRVSSGLGLPFNRGDNERPGSTGLGLALVHSLCRRYGWSLHFTRVERQTVVLLSEDA